MKRTLKSSVSDNHTSECPKKKRQKLNDCNKRCNNVHQMKLRYASNLDKSKYDKCRKCLTINDYESMHFIYECITCTYFVCNFCMADIYNYNTNLNNIINMSHSNKKTKSKQLNTIVKSSGLFVCFIFFLSYNYC
eukprot:102330_1